MKRSNLLIGVDSDGTVFDSMVRKHERAFIPAVLEIWPMKGEVKDRFIEIEKHVNLYSELRGVNRFVTVLEVFEQLKAAFPEETGLPDPAPLRAYIEAESRYSVESLQAWMQKHPSFELAKVLSWSKRADALFDQVSAGMLPFDGVKDALSAAAKEASVVVISSARREFLKRDWLFGGLMGQVGWIMGQEDGGEDEQLKKAMAHCESDVQVLMIGDTEVDREAVHSVGGRFYPIVPGDESASWAKFSSEVLPMFLEGKYDDEAEAACYAALKNVLK